MTNPTLNPVAPGAPYHFFDPRQWARVARDRVSRGFALAAHHGVPVPGHRLLGQVLFDRFTDQPLQVISVTSRCSDGWYNEATLFSRGGGKIFAVVEIIDCQDPIVLGRFAEFECNFAPSGTGADE